MDKQSVSLGAFDHTTSRCRHPTPTYFVLFYFQANCKMASVVLCQSTTCPNGNPPSRMECPTCNKCVYHAQLSTSYNPSTSQTRDKRIVLLWSGVLQIRMYVVCVLHVLNILNPTLNTGAGFRQFTQKDHLIEICTLNRNPIKLFMHLCLRRLQRIKVIGFSQSRYCSLIPETSRWHPQSFPQLLVYGASATSVSAFCNSKSS